MLIPVSWLLRINAVCLQLLTIANITGLCLCIFLFPSVCVCVSLSVCVSRSITVVIHIWYGIWNSNFQWNSVKVNDEHNLKNWCHGLCAFFVLRINFPILFTIKIMKMNFIACFVPFFTISTLKFYLKLFFSPVKWVINF